MRIGLAKMLLTGLLVLSPAAGWGWWAEPVTDFSGWVMSTPYGFVSIGILGDQVFLEADGSQGASRGVLLGYYPGALGLEARVMVTRVEGSAYVGIRKCVGMLGEKEVVAELSLERWEGKRSVRYRIYEREPGSDEEEMVAVGFFGAWDDAWQEEDPVLLTLRRRGNSVIFRVGGHEATMHYCPISPMEFVDAPVEINVWAAPGTENYLQAVVEEVSVLYPGWARLPH